METWNNEKNGKLEIWKRADHGTTVRHGHDVIAYADPFHAYASSDANILAPLTWGIAAAASSVAVAVADVVAVVSVVVVVVVAPTFLSAVAHPHRCTAQCQCWNECQPTKMPEHA